MAKNPYLKQHKSFCEWFEQNRDTMPAELRSAAERFRAALWGAAHNPKPPAGFTQELETFMRARNQFHDVN